MVYGMKLQQVNSDLKEKCLVVSNIGNIHPEELGMDGWFNHLETRHAVESACVCVCAILVAVLLL